MLVKKFVPCIYLYRQHAVRGLNDTTIVETDPLRLVQLYNENNADELIVFDMSEDDASHEEALDMLKEICALAEVDVIGAGNVAMDAARTAKRNGAEDVYVAYRRDFEDMTATKHEISEAIEEGILFKTFEAPVEIVDDGIILARTEKKEVDGKSTVSMIPDSEYLFECDSILIAVSQAPKNTIVVNNKGVDTTKRGHIETDEKGHTTKEGVFACGDVVLGASTVIQAVNSAKIVSESMDEYLQEITEEEVI